MEEGESFCRWIIGGETTAIVALVLYIVRDWANQKAKYEAEIASLKKLLSEEEA